MHEPLTHAPSHAAEGTVRRGRGVDSRRTSGGLSVSRHAVVIPTLRASHKLATPHHPQNGRTVGSADCNENLKERVFPT